MKYKLSFASVNVLASNIVEIIINKNVQVTLEMLDESHALLEELFPFEPFGILMNRVYPHDFTFEAKLSLASYDNLSAIAVVNYSQEQFQGSKEIQVLRKIDDLNMKDFSGLDLGWQDAQQWLTTQLPVTQLRA